MNNALGLDFLSAQDMTQACDIYLEEMEFEGSMENRSDHETETGWYSEAVMAQALRVKLNIYKLDLDNPLQPKKKDLMRIFEDDVIGVVVNKSQEHWYAIKMLGQQIWLLGSTERPKTMTFQTFLACIREHRILF